MAADRKGITIYLNALILSFVILNF